MHGGHERYAITANCTTTTAKVEDMVKISGNGEVAVAAAGENAVGEITYIPSAGLPGDVTVETRYMRKKEVVFSETLAPGEFTKIGAPDGSGNQRHAKWIQGTDAEALKIGEVLFGGDADATGEILY